MQIFVGLILGLGARVPQILLNRKNGHTGNLALPTYLFNTTANVVCCTATAVITGDVYVMCKELWMLSLNATIVTQILGTLAKQRNEAAAQQQHKGIATSPMRSGEYGEFEGSFRSRSRSVQFTGRLPLSSVSLGGSGDDDGEGGFVRKGGNGEVPVGHTSRGAVLRPGASSSWSLDTSSRTASRPRRAGVHPYSLEAEKLGSLDEYDRLKREKNGSHGSMDGMRPSVA